MSGSSGGRSPVNHETRGEPRHRADSHQGDIYIVPGAPHHPASLCKIRESKLSPIPDLDLEAASVDIWKDKVESSRDPNETITPSKRGSQRQRRASSWLRRFSLHWLTAYRILIALTIVINAVIMVFLVTLKRPLEDILVATAANLLVLILARQEDLINMSFCLIAKIPSSLPLSLRKVIADFHHYGGIHIGTAISALLWYILFVGLNTSQCILRAKQGSMTGWNWADITTCYVFVAIILIICITSIPRLRERFHNLFEFTHRFAGWVSLIVLWINSGISTMADPEHTPLYMSRSIWLLAIATFLIILPWLRIRSVPIRAQPISSREIKLSFPYINMPYTSTSRLSLSPLLEWHAFATIPSADGSSASVIVSAAGDWTERIIANPPERMWIRHPPAANFLAFTPLFNSVLLVATGAGIAPMLSLLASPAVKAMLAAGKKIKVMWSVRDPDATHWQFVQDAIRKVDPLPKIFDSKIERPDVAFEARNLAHFHDMEAVMVVSNKEVTNAVVREVKAHGGAAYGAVFDS